MSLLLTASVQCDYCGAEVDGPMTVFHAKDIEAAITAAIQTAARRERWVIDDCPVTRRQRHRCPGCAVEGEGKP